MSDDPPDAARDGAHLSPAKKVGIWVIVLLVGIGFMVAFSGKINLVSKPQVKTAQAQTPMNANINPVVRPPGSQIITTPPPRYVQPVSGGGNSVDDDRMKARMSPISAYSARVASNDGAGGHGPDRPAPGSADALEASLVPSQMDGVKVSELPNPRWLVEQGRILSCTQITKANTTMPGGVSALIPEEIRGGTGDVVLFDKGATMFGTIQRALMNGAERMGVLWQNIRTPVLYDARGMPHKFTIAVNSPASSELGEIGLDMDVDRHLALKIGGILGYSLVQGGIQYAVNEASQSRGGGTTLNLNSFQQSSSQAAEALLRAWVDIPDVGTRDQGRRCGIQIIRDLDMRAAYALRRKYTPQQTPRSPGL